MIEQHRDRYPVAVMCDAMEVSPSGYYAWRSQPESPRVREDRRLKVMIRSVFKESRET